MSAERACGTCDLCCTVLRVDDLAKLGGRRCMHQRVDGGCGVYARRPEICRAYQCAWLEGAFEDGDRPDALGAVLDFVPRGDSVRLVIRQADAGAYRRSPRLRALAEETRRTMLVEIRDVEHVLDPARPFQVLQTNGVDLHIAGDHVEVRRGSEVLLRRRKPWMERLAGRLSARIAAFRIGRWPSHEARARHLAEPESD